jgi:hypothetical protein
LADVYSNAYPTIAAAYGSNMTAGLFLGRVGLGRAFKILSFLKSVMVGTYRATAGLGKGVDNLILQKTS